MIWWCFCNNKLGLLVLVEGTLNSDKYIELLEEHLLPFLTDLKKENKEDDENIDEDSNEEKEENDYIF